MKKPLSHFRNMTRRTIAKLDGMKSIMRVETARKREWWLVLPAVGDSDAACVLLHKVPSREPSQYVEKRILNEYADRIVTA